MNAIFILFAALSPFPIGNRPGPEHAAVTVDPGQVYVYSREISVHNFPPPVTRAFSREVSVSNSTADADHGNVASREFSLNNFRDPVVLAESRELSLNHPTHTEQLHDAWSRELSLNNFPTGFTTAFSREISVNQRAESNVVGNIWARETSLNNRFISPTTIAIENGIYVSGTTASLKEVDTDEYVAKGVLAKSGASGSSQGGLDPLSLKVEFTSDVDIPSRVELQLYGRVDRPGVRWSIDFFNWVTHKYVRVYSDVASQTNVRVTAVQVPINGNFIDQANLTFRARIHAAQAQDFKTPFNLSIDQVLFVVSR